MLRITWRGPRLGAGRLLAVGSLVILMFLAVVQLGIGYHAPNVLAGCANPPVSRLALRHRGRGA